MKLYSKIYGDTSQDLIIIHGLFGMSDNWNSLVVLYFKSERHDYTHQVQIHAKPQKELGGQK